MRASGHTPNGATVRRTRSRTLLKRTLIRIGTVLGSAALLAVAFPEHADAATSLVVRGAVVCPSQSPVVGVWVTNSGGGGAYANWTAYPGRPHVARYQTTLTTTLPARVSLHVGCGGTRQSWGSSNASPAATVRSGAILFLNARCGSGKCSFPPLEGNTPAAPSKNSFFDSTRGDPLRNGEGWCTYRAAAFWKTMTGRFPNWNGDAGYWDNNAGATGWKVEGVPYPDSIVVWQPGTASRYGHVGYVADVRVSSGKLQMKVYDRNWDGRGGDRNGVWVDSISSMKFISAPPQTEAKVR